jgi:C4-dicarboxylate-specific signal transduction histidine kinase
MHYIPKYPKVLLTLPTPPTTAVGFRRRFEADTKMLGRLEETHRLVFLKIVRSWTFMQAETLGEAKFRQLRRELSMRASKLSWHKLIAENAGKLLSVVKSLPNDDEALALLANLDEDRLHYLYRSRQLNQSVRAFRLKELATLESSNA